VDPVGDVQAGRLALVLDLADDVAHVPVAQQFGVQRRVQHHEAAAGEHRGDVVALPAEHLGGEAVLLGEERHAVDHQAAVVRLLPHPLARRADHPLHVAAQAGARDAGVDRHLGEHAVLRGGLARDVLEVHLLDVDLLADEPGERREAARVREHHAEAAQWLPHAQGAGLADAERGGDDVADGLHGGHEVVIGQQGGGHGVGRGDDGAVRRLVQRNGPVLQVDAATPGQAPPHLFRGQRGKRRHHAGEDLEGGPQRVERARVLGPEALARGPHVPVGQQVEVVAHRGARTGHVVGLEQGLHLEREGVRARQEVAVHDREVGHLLGEDGAGEQALAVGAALALSTLRGVRVEAEEVPGVP